MKPIVIAAALLAAACPPAWAGDPELAALREEVAQLKRAYEQRIAALEARLAQAEASAGGSAVAPTAEAARPAAPAGEGAFNPALSLILAGTYTRLSQDPNDYRIGGFVPTLGEVAPPRRGFALGESELSIAANIDPNLRGQFTAAVPPEGGGASVEEAFIQTLALGEGLSLKAGRFLSGIGYLNEQHAHAWDFADAPLAYKAFLGGQLKSDGVQLKWLAPTDLFLELGAEAAAGGAFPSTENNRSGSTLGALFAHAGGDLGDSHSWRAGVSVLGTSPRDRRFADMDSAGVPVTDGFSGRSRTWLADFTWKWAPHGNPVERNFKLQAELFQRRESGTLTYDVGGARLGPLADGYASTQAGGYAQAVWQFMPRWRVGFRYDRLDSGRTDIGLVDTGRLAAADFPILAGYRPKRASLMADWSSSEFARLRLQFARDESRPGAADNQVWLQYVASIGAHGAHKF